MALFMASCMLILVKAHQSGRVDDLRPHRTSMIEVSHVLTMVVILWVLSPPPTHSKQPSKIYFKIAYGIF